MSLELISEQIFPADEQYKHWQPRRIHSAQAFKVADKITSVYAYNKQCYSALALTLN